MGARQIPHGTSCEWIIGYGVQNMAHWILIMMMITDTWACCINYRSGTSSLVAVKVTPLSTAGLVGSNHPVPSSLLFHGNFLTLLYRAGLTGWRYVTLLSVSVMLLKYLVAGHEW